MRKFLLTSTALTLVAIASPALAEDTPEDTPENTPLTIELTETEKYGPLTITSSGNAVNSKDENYGGSVDPIIVKDGTIITNSTLISNLTPDEVIYDKAAITYEGKNITISATIHDYYSSVNRGSAIYISGEGLTLTDSKFNNNKNTKNGGGALYNAGAQTKITGSIFTSNSTLSHGGAIYDYGGFGSGTTNATTTTIANSKFNNNIAQTNAGAIYYDGRNNSSSLSIEGSTFTGNTATTGDGGAIYMNAGNLNFTGVSTFSGNTANGSANDIYLNSGVKMNIAEKASVTLGNRNSGVATDEGGVSGSGAINIDGTFDIGLSDINASSINFNSGSNLYITVSYLNSNFDYGKLTGNVTANGNLKFFMDDTTYNAITADGKQASIKMDKFATVAFNQTGLNYIYSNGAYVISKAVSYLGPNLYLFAGGETIPSDFYPTAESGNWGKTGSYTITDSPSDPNESKIKKILNTAFDGVAGLISGATAAVINNATDPKTYAFDIQGYKGTGNGGAVINNGDLTIASGSIFNNNEAQNGGAIYNDAGKNLTIQGIATITNNNATSNGGAIYNAGTLALNTSTGDITFSGNTANGNNNDIYNTGTINISGNGTLKINGGINNIATSKNGTITVDGTTLALGNNADIFASSMSFTNGALNAADGADLTTSGDISFSGTKLLLTNSQINADNLSFENGSLSLGSSNLSAQSTLSFTNMGTIDASNAILGGTDISFNNTSINIGSNELHATGDISFTNNSNLFLTVQNETDYGKLTANTITNDNGKITVTVASNAFDNDDDGEITVEILQADATDGLTAGDFNAPIAADNNFFEIKYSDADDGSYIITKKNDPTPPTPTPGGETMGIAEAWQKAGFTSAGAEEVYQHLQHVGSLKDAYTALAPTEAPVIQTALIQIQNQIIGAVSSQLTGGLSSPVSEGKSAGDGILNKVRSWVKLLVNHAKYSAHNGFSSDVQGVSMGVDKLIREDFRLGLGYAYTNGDIDGFWRSSDLTSHTAILYGEYKPSNWYVNGIATYGWADYEEKKNLQGLLVRSKYDVDSFGLQVMTGYDFGIYTPEIGLRYARFKRDGYRDTADQYVSSNTSDILTAIMGVKFEKQFTTCGGTRWKPEARLAATYDLITDEDNALVTLNNGAAYEAKGEHLKRFGVEFGAGVNIEVNDKVDISFGYEGHFRKDYQDHTGMVSAIYKF